ncbi:hypothetical protein ABT56_22155 [Photobacterium aquae]|uniref:CRISPR-associated protein n=1 Tax=Photobacterium aquae TaxID=1195763 RepID=A0A0J1GNW3_9GAMM|nr:hypothetical protein [Photobacterium aquae]KLV01463.1 hypothetical protein ABT56_22155 [Photobacterium aquae]
MIHSYLFEAKSIQSYLFRTGKLRDVIAASERLDSLIDSSKNSVLFHVLTNANLQSDLLDAGTEDKPHLIRFLRCKGGAFYAYCQQPEPLLALRSLWTLTVQQLFPSLEFTDALTEASTLPEALDKAHKELAADRNTPEFKFPLATAITQRYSHTGAVSVPISDLANRASMKDELGHNSLDLDTELHRQSYQSLNMRDRAALQDRFTPEKLKGKVFYPINLEKDFQYSSPDVQAKNRAEIKDIALIHIDGNGLGILLIGLRDVLKGKSNDEYRNGFRQFSDALAQATEKAAQTATQWIYDQACYRHTAEGDNDEKDYLPMRPLVLGGDDLTLLCRADLAVEYSKRFCREFKKESQLALAGLYSQHLRNSGIKKYLTASGGILYHKAGHPFTYSHHLVEDLCQEAKALTKSLNKSDKEVGPAALAFFRLSNAISASLTALKQQSQQFDVKDSHDSFSLELCQSAFFVDAEHDGASDFNALDKLVKLCRGKAAPVSMTKWRQMVTHLALGNKVEADRIYARAIERCQDHKAIEQLMALFNTFAADSDQVCNWYWRKENGNYQTVISDMLIYDHFLAVPCQKNVTVPEGNQ